MAVLSVLPQFTNPLMALLLVAGALTFMAYGLQSPRDKNNAILAAALIIVVTFTCLMSYFQERSASNVMGAHLGRTAGDTDVGLVCALAPQSDLTSLAQLVLFVSVQVVEDHHTASKSI